MRYSRVIAPLLLVFSISLAASALELATEDDPPHNMIKNGKVVGLATEQLEEAFRQASIDQHIELMPWARAYQSALKQPGYCVFSAARTAEREPLFKWVGPIAAMDWVLYTRTNTKPVPTKLEQVRAETIGGYLQDVITVWLTKEGYQVDAATNDNLNPKKLLQGRINYWASSRPRATALLAKENLNDQIVPALTFGHTDLYLACHPSTADDVVAKLNTALKKMREDGTSAKIEKRYAK